MYEKNKRLAERWFEEVWNLRRENAIDELLAEDGVAFGLDRVRHTSPRPERIETFRP